MIIINCRFCKKETSCYPSEIKRGKRYCSLECRSKDWGWRINMGAARLKNPEGFKHTKFMSQYGARNKPKICEHCGTEENLHIHHKDQDRTNNEESNLAILCNSCHNKEHNWPRCNSCGQLKPKENHECPDRKTYRKIGLKNYLKRQRAKCSNCGKFIKGDGNDCC